MLDDRNWANADWPLRINADRQCEHRDLVVSCRAERDSQNEILQAPLEAA